MAASLHRLSAGYRAVMLPACARSHYVGKPRLRETGFDRAGYHEPEVLQSYEQIQAARLDTDSERDRVVNIGLPRTRTRQESRAIEKQQAAHLREVRSDPRLEKAARLRNLQVPLKDVAADFRQSDGPREICNAAMHYGIFEDLFGAAFFYPQVALDIQFSSGDDEVMPVHRGNWISPADAKKAPEVSFASDDSSLWTLMLTNLDGHLQNNGSEYIHWFIGNIPGNNVSQGEELIDYLQPVPMRGTGFHRYVFLLFKQSSRIDYSPFKRQAPCLDLQSRTFHMPSFYRGHQDVLTPAGLGFFLAEWDQSVTDTFHRKLDAVEPMFEYQHRPLDHPPQRIFPGTQPFNMYLDRYREKQDIGEEMVKKRMKTVHPFRPDPPRWKYPMAQGWNMTGYHGTVPVPSWKRVEIAKEQLGHSRYKLVYNPWANWGGIN